MTAHAHDVDPITLEVIRSALKHNLDEIELALCRTAYSSTVYEVRDMCAGWIDAEGRLLAQGRYGLPIFMADLATSVMPGIELFGSDGYSPGDVIITNHAETCGQHLNNVVVYAPIFHQDELIAFTATRAHWADVGGKAVGSYSTDSTEIFQEGIQWNQLKVMKGGREDQEVMRMIANNVRFPDQVIGDMRAQITACRLGERRLLEMVERYGIDTLRACMQKIWAQSEARAREVVAGIPDGTYTASAFLDNDGINLDERLNIEVAVTIQGSDMIVDLTGTHAQVQGPMNSGAAGALAAVRVAFKCITAPGTTPDEGAFRPLSVVVPKGTFVSAEPPAPLAQWVIMMPTLIETVFLALAPVLPGRIPAAHMGDMSANFFYQQSTPTKQGFVHADPFPGGWGARPNGDGPVPLKSYCHGDTNKISVELEELKFPFRVLRYEMRADSGGVGEFRGGPGLDREFELLEDVMITTSLERSECPPWGLEGGGAGGAPIAILQTPAGGSEGFHKATMKPVPAGSRLLISTAGGGGFGNPSRRDPERVLLDVVRGMVTERQARSEYLVAIVPGTKGLEIDVAETHRLRAEEQAKRGTQG